MIPGRVSPPRPDVSTTAPSSAEADGLPVTWRSLLPIHRLSVVSKTPFLIATGAYVAGLREPSSGLSATVILGAALWICLYAFNELTDLRLEAGREVSDAVVRGLGVVIAAICMIAALVSPVLAILLLVMVAGQLAYCAPPWRLKRFWWAALVLSGTVNPMVRMACGGIWAPKGVPLGAYFIVIALHLGAASRSRLLLRRRDAGLGYATAPDWLRYVGMVSSAAGLLGILVLSQMGGLPSYFAPLALGATLFTLYAWSDRATNVARLRHGWIGFTVASVFVLYMLLRVR